MPGCVVCHTPAMGDALDLLSHPTYGFSQVDRILRLKSGTSQRWIDGYDRAGRHYEPVVREHTTADPVVTWGEFVEARMLAEYRDAGVSMLRMRPAVERLRETFGPYPLASARLWLGHDGRDLVLRAQRDARLDRALWIVVPRLGDQPLLPGVVSITWSQPARRFRESLIWSDDTDQAVLTGLHPQADNSDVRIDPRFGFGEPTVRSVPTETIAELIRAGDPEEMIADHYELTLSQVQAAVRYELSRAA